MAWEWGWGVGNMSGIQNAMYVYMSNLRKSIHRLFQTFLPNAIHVQMPLPCIKDSSPSPPLFPLSLPFSFSRNVWQTLLTVGELCLADEVSALQFMNVPNFGCSIVREGGKDSAVLEHLDSGRKRGRRWDEKVRACNHDKHCAVLAMAFCKYKRGIRRAGRRQEERRGRSGWREWGWWKGRRSVRREGGLWERWRIVKTKLRLLPTCWWILCVHECVQSSDLLESTWRQIVEASTISTQLARRPW